MYDGAPAPQLEIRRAPALERRRRPSPPSRIGDSSTRSAADGAAGCSTVIDEQLGQRRAPLRRPGRRRDGRCGSDRTCRRECRCAAAVMPPIWRDGARGRCHIASSSSGTPCAGHAGDAEERAGPAPPRARSSAVDARRRRPRRSCWRRRVCGLAASVGLKELELAADACRGRPPDRGRCALDTSTRCTSTFVRSRWRRNWWPRPWPRCAPSIRPGTSATTKLRSSLRRDDAEIRRQRRERVVGDLRAGRRDARDQRRLAGVREADQADVGEQLQLEPQVLVLARLSPAARRRGARLVDVAKRALPRPPWPPCATSTRWPRLGQVGEQPVRLAGSSVFS